VIVLDLLKRGSDGISQHFSNPHFTLINGDFTTDLLKFTLKAFEPDVVIHLAAIVGDPACAREPDLATKTNVEGTKWVVDCCNEYDLDLFFASTCSVYGSNEETCDELTDPNPLSHYARTKLSAERYIQDHSRNGIIFRFGTMHGVSPQMRYDLVVNRLARDASIYSSFNVFDGTQHRPFLHPRDLAHFFLQLIGNDLSAHYKQVYNLVSENLSMLEVGELIERLIPHSKMNVVREKEDDRTYICRSFKAHSRLNFCPVLRVRESIQEIERYVLMKEKKDIKITD